MVLANRTEILLENIVALESDIFQAINLVVKTWGYERGTAY